MKHAGPVWPGVRSGPRAGLFGLTLLLHTALLWLLLLPHQPDQDRSAAHRVTDLVWIRTPEPVPAEARAAVTRARKVEQPEKARPSVAARPLRRAPPIPAPAVPARPEPGTASMAQPVLAVEPAPPVFDRAAAMAAARRIATEGEPFRSGMAVAQTPARPVYGETKDEKLGRMIAGAKRGNCLGPNAGGSLLTPLMWLIDKKDGGCKF